MNNKSALSKGRFSKGKSGNAAGRPPGSRNKSTLLAEQLLEGESEKLMQKAIELAMKGNPYALRLCLERMIPIRKERTIELPMDPNENPNDPSNSHLVIFNAVRNSILTPAEGLSMSAMVTAQENSIGTKELALRVKDLELHRDEIRRFENRVAGEWEAQPAGITLEAVK